MPGPARRPDVVGTVFGAFLLLALFAITARVLWPSDGAVASLGRLVPILGDDRAATARDGVEEDEALDEPRSLDPLYYDGPRELVPAAAHEPAELRLPTLGVRSRLLRLDKRADGSMEVPGDFGLAGWYVRGPAPGQVGPAVVAGHLDSRRGPAVFARLGELEPGDEILVERGDGHVVRFVVRRVASYDKNAFPTAQVYGDTTGPELRLITCDGDFDRRRRSYEDNLVVYATADPATLPPDPGPSTPRETPSGEPGGDGAAPSPDPEGPGETAAPRPSPSSTPGTAPSEPGPKPAPSSPQPGPPSQSPSPSPSGLPTEEPTASPRPSGGVRLP